MPYIENISLRQAVKGDHWNRGQDSVLIQIVNPAYGFPNTSTKFSEVFQFEILDAEDRDNFHEDAKFSTEQAAQIVKILVDALDANKNVTVHCHMGISRSGAVALIGSFIGFELRTKNQVPNRLMQKLMERELYNNYQDYI